MERKRKPQPTLALQSAIVQILFCRVNGTCSHIHAELRTTDKWRFVSEAEVQANLDALLVFRTDITKDGPWYSHAMPVDAVGGES